MRLLVCGSRTWTGGAEYHRVEDEIRALAPALVMHGGARGADECADMCCRCPERPIPLLLFRANWEADGKAAGPLRNARMLRDGKPDRGLAFGALWKPSPNEEAIRRAVGAPFARAWKHTGTGNMVFRMLDAGLPVRWVESVDAVVVDLSAMPESPR